MNPNPVRENKEPDKEGVSSRWLLFVVLLAGALAVLFIRSFEPNQVLFANDGPLGALKATWNRLPSGFVGIWEDLSWLGAELPSAAPRISAFMLALLPPVLYQKTFPPFTLFFLGFSAWLFFRQLKFNPVVCALGGVAAGLNMHNFSVACWGLGTWDLAIGSIFLALAALASPAIKQWWAKAILAGLAVGMNVMEGFDCGAILSIYVGAFVLFVVFNQDAPRSRKIVQTVEVGMLVVFFSALLAAHSIASLIGTQILGVGGNAQDEQTKIAHWDFDTQWSLPKAETLRIFIPGVFGYRLDQYITTADKSSAYWGISGQDPKIAKLNSSDPKVRVQAAAMIGAPPQMQEVLAGDDTEARAHAVEVLESHANLYPRHTGSGEYAGELVTLLALFGIASAFRRVNPPYSRKEARAVWFWTGAALFSLMAAWGRYGFLYGLLYRVPYVSTIRNPIKFMHPFHVSWVILAAYGLEALARTARQKAGQPLLPFSGHLKRWWKKVSGFEKNWTTGLVVFIGLSMAALIVMSGMKTDLVKYLTTEFFSPEAASKVIDFSLGEIAWFIIYLVLSAFVFTGLLSGAWQGAKQKWGWIFLGAILIFDLGRSDTRWINYFDYKEKYSMNPAVETLENDPFAQRVTTRLTPGQGMSLSGNNTFNNLCFFWLQNDFPYHDIQSIEIIQAPRMPDLDRTYMGAFEPTSADLWPATRLWQLTNTRYLLGTASLPQQLNADPNLRGENFRLLDRYTMVRKPGITNIEDVGDITVQRDPQGEFGLIEFTNALPRAKLYNHWTSVNDAATLEKLKAPEFDPTKTVLLATDTPITESAPTTEADPGTVTITHYLPKDVQLQADAKTPSILLLNDRVAPTWKVWVDKKPAAVLRCNYIMRGVFLPAGEHKVEFRYQPPLTTFYISLSGWAVGFLLAGYLVVTRPPRSNA